MSFFRLTLILFISFFVTFVFSLNSFIESFPVKSDDQIEFDGIVVLTGGEGRLNAGKEALLNKKNTKLLVTGVGEKTSLEELGLSSQSIQERVNIDRLARTTFENAREIKIWAENNAFRNILLVTSAYHMPRSILVLNYIVPKLKFIAFPVYTERVKLKEWWLWPGTTKLLIHEYFKYIYAHLQIFFLKHLVHI